LTLYAIALSIGLVTTLLAGFYYRIAEQDVLASQQVWDRLADKVKAMIDDDEFPDEMANDMVIFSLLAGCGCFTVVTVKQWLRSKLRRRKALPDADIAAMFELMTDERRHKFSAIMTDLMLFDSLHAPITGRLLRAIYRDQFRRAAYRTPSVECSDSDVKAHEIKNIAIATRSVETVFRAKRNTALVTSHIPASLFATA
jgi:hypothetical protein